MTSETPEYQQVIDYLVSKLRALKKIERFCTQIRRDANANFANGFDASNPSHHRLYGADGLAGHILKLIKGEK